MRVDAKKRLAVLAVGAAFSACPVSGADAFEVRSLDGSANNRAHPAWGQVGTQYSRVAPPAYADGAGAQGSGPNARYISNRVFDDLAQNIFSERGVSQWAWTWGQFMDHTFGLAAESKEKSPIAFDAGDPLETFRNDLGTISFARDAAAPGTGGDPSAPRQQTNTVSSYIDGWSVYGGTRERLEWLREGSVDGDLSNNGAHLLLTRDGYLPRATARGDAGAAPDMKVDGALRMHPGDAAVAGDVRANENMALTAVHTLFAREHNRIVDRLPKSLPEEQKFQIARRVVGAEQQWITYREFLPSLGVKLPRYTGYRPSVDPSIGNEFATVAYRAHSMIHGEFDIDERQVSLSEAFFNPNLVESIGLSPVLKSLGAEPQYNNDEQIDNSLRSVLFQLPGPSAPDPAACFRDPRAAGCFQGVVDLGALDIQRGRDHGMPSYNDLRRAVGLPARTSFAAITGEESEEFPNDPKIDSAKPIDDPDIMDYAELTDADGRRVPAGSDNEEDRAVRGTRRTPLAARLKAIYGSVEDVDAFVGMVAEPHRRGSEFGQLQLALWKRQFQALRDGDRFFYANDPALERIRRRFKVDFRHSLAELIALNTDATRGELARNVFFAPAEEGEEAEDDDPAAEPEETGDRAREPRRPRGRHRHRSRHRHRGHHRPRGHRRRGGRSS